MMSEIESLARRRPVEIYARALEHGASHKLRLFARWLSAPPGELIVDLGGGTGALACHLGRRHPACRVLVVDAATPLLRIASRRRTPNISVRHGDILDTQVEDASTVILSSVLHEVYSHAGDSFKAVERVLRAAWESLRVGGRLLVRDFVQPSFGAREIELRHECSNVVSGHDFPSMVKHSPRPLRLDDRRRRGDAFIYRTDLASALEFVLRNRFHSLWQWELMERYAFWTAQHARFMIEGAGFRLIHEEPDHSDGGRHAATARDLEISWVLTGRNISLPPAMRLFVAEKAPLPGPPVRPASLRVSEVGEPERFAP